MSLKIDLSDPETEWIVSKFLRTAHKLLNPKDYTLTIESRIEYTYQPVYVLGQYDPVEMEPHVNIIPSVVTWRRKSSDTPEDL